MGGVDLSDALIGYYSILHKTRRWYRSFFYNFVDIAIVNAFLLHKELARIQGERPMTQKTFRENLVLQLKEVGSSRSTTPTPPPIPASRDHMPTFRGPDGTHGRQRCILCKQKTPIACSFCEVALCIIPKRNCFADWHAQNQA